MTFGPQQPGWTPQQPGYPMPQPRPYGQVARSPLPTLLGVLGLILTVFFAYTTIFTVIAQNTLVPIGLVRYTFFEVPFGWAPGIVMVVEIVLVLLLLVGSILLLRRTRAGRIIAAVPGLLMLVALIIGLARYGFGGPNVATWVVSILGIVLAVFCVLPMTGKAMNTGFVQPGMPPQQGFAQPGYPQPGFAQPGYPPQQGIQQPGYPQQQGIPQPGYPQQPGCPPQQPGYPPQQPPRF